jgi:8-oxo-dGTP pyrophosphatase MutT (NUDIX family)
MTFIDKLALVLVRNRQQLVTRSRGKVVYFTPGGKREPGESDIQALRRECKEELTVELTPETIQPFGVFSAQAFGKPPGTMVRMTCYTADYEGALTPNEEVEELAWIQSDCPDEKLTVTGKMVLEDLKERNFID